MTEYEANKIEGRALLLICLWLVAMIGIVIIIAGCAPMPGNTLYPGLSEPTKLEEIADYKVVINPITTPIECNKILLKYEQYGLFALNFVGNLGYIVGCADLHASVETGKIDKCHVYIAFPFDLLLFHENRHCMGYQD